MTYLGASDITTSTILTKSEGNASRFIDCAEICDIVEGAGLFMIHFQSKRILWGNSSPKKEPQSVMVLPASASKLKNEGKVIFRRPDPK